MIDVSHQSDSLQMFNSVVTLIGTCFTGYLAYLIAKLNADQRIRGDQQMKVATQASDRVEEVRVQATKAAVRVEKVASVAAENAEKAGAKLDGLATVAKATHTLVNSNMAVQLLLNRDVTRRLADLTGKRGDIEAADLANELYEQHVTRQSQVDAQDGSAGQKDGSDAADRIDAMRERH